MFNVCTHTQVVELPDADVRVPPPIDAATPKVKKQKKKSHFACLPPSMPLPLR